MATTGSAGRKTFVLVPGAWHGAWCWRRVADRLIAQGHAAYALSLTGVADRSHLSSDAVDLTTHVLDVANLVLWEDLRDIVLVGHSYAGIVIAAAAEKIGDRVASIVFLDAFIPADGQSMADITKREIPSTGVMTPYPAKAMGVNAADEDWVNAKVTTQPVNTYREKVHLTGAYERIAKKAYVRTLGFANPLFQATYEALRAKPDWQTFSIDSGHDAMIDKPNELAAILQAAS